VSLRQLSFNCYVLRVQCSTQVAYIAIGRGMGSCPPNCLIIIILFIYLLRQQAAHRPTWNTDTKTKRYIAHSHSTYSTYIVSQQICLTKFSWLHLRLMYPRMSHVGVQTKKTPRVIVIVWPTWVLWPVTIATQFLAFPINVVWLRAWQYINHHAEYLFTLPVLWIWILIILSYSYFAWSWHYCVKLNMI